MKKRLQKMIFALFLTGAFFVARPLGAQSVALIVTERAFAYEKAAKEIESGFGGQIQSFDMKDSHERDDAIVQKVMEFNPSVVVTLGDKARELATKKLTSFPILAGMVLEPGPEPPRGVRLQMVTLQIPPQSILTQLRLLIPQMKRIGVVSGETRFISLRKSLHDVAQTMGVEVVDILVSDKSKTVEQVETKLPELDAVWLLPDFTILDIESFRKLVDKVNKSKKALIAYSENFVKAGALFSVSPDYQAAGQQLVMLARKMISEKKTVAPTIQYPIGTYSVINMETARLIGLQLSPEQIGFINRILEGNH